jgi:tetratricopeptide (TPR) repeat protein
VGERGPSVEVPTISVSRDGTLRTVIRVAAPEVGARLGQFRIDARIGQGGLGIVYRAWDDKLKRAVALKVLAESSSTAAVHLLEEARAAASLTHPAIAAIHDVQQHDGIAFIVMELVAGTTLRAQIDRGPIAPDVAVRHARDVAAALARAHRAGIVHRDLKPENVMVTADGDAKVLDFGLARYAPDAVAPNAGEGATGVSGTPDYMAPEQARGLRVDARADVFSFGVLLYEMLSGKRPFARRRGVIPGDEEGPASDAWTVLAPLGEAARGAPAELVRIAERCLAFDRDARFADGAALLAALRELAVAAPRRRPSLARRALWSSGAVLVAGAVAAGVIATRPRDVAPVLAALGRRPAVAVIGPPGDTMADLVSAELATGDALRVVPRDVLARSVAVVDAARSDPTPDQLAKLAAIAGADVVVETSTEAHGADARVRLRVHAFGPSGRAPEPVAAAIDGPAADRASLAARAGDEIRARLGRSRLTPAEEEAARAILPRGSDAAQAYARGVACRARYDYAGAREAFQQAVGAEDDFALGHLELSRALTALHLDPPALAEATRALDLASRFGREQHLVIEAQHAVAARDWRAASDIDRTLFGFFPDNLDYGVDYARAQVFSGQRDEAFATLDRLRAAPRTAADDVRLDMLEEFLSGKVADIKRRLAAALRAKEKADAMGASWMAADARRAVTEARLDLGDPDVDVGDLEEARAIYERFADDSGTAAVLEQEGDVKARRGDLAGAIALDDRGLVPARRAGDAYRLGGLATSRALILFRAGDLRGAEAGFDEGRRIYEDIHDDEGVAHDIGNAALARITRGEIAGARDAFERARAIHRRIGMKRGAAEQTGNVALAAFLEGDLAGAAREVKDAIEQARAVEAAEDMWHALVTEGDLLRAQGDGAGAKRAYGEAADLAARAGAADAGAEIQVAQARLALEDGDAREAERLTRASLERFVASKNDPQAALARAVLVRALVSEGDAGGAERALVELDAALPGCQLFQARLLEKIASSELAALRGDRDGAARFAAEARALADAAAMAPAIFEARLAEARAAGGASRAAFMARLAKDARAAGFVRVAVLASGR